ncbi:SDR family oxidoreductase [Mucilaginibacter terrae]|uniref:SDR family oxidoreductase n=1 Tax=Mucilaginibacter terrae TaxID=1955052 RepID=UPI00363D6044
MNNLKDTVVIVIGGSSGIGYSVAEQAFAQGAKVTVTSRDHDRGRRAAGNISDQVDYAALDVNQEETINNFFGSIPSVDHIYIAAGSTKLGSVTDKKLEDHMQSFNERILGYLRIVRAVAGKINPSGSITFTGGISTDRPIAGAWVSGLATASAEQLARVLVMEFPAIRFNAVSPGYTDTPMWDAIMGESKVDILNSVAEKLPVKKIATPGEVASAVLFFMSNPSVTGEVIHVDGGGRLV